MLNLKTVFSVFLLLFILPFKSHALSDNLDSIEKIFENYNVFCFHDSKKELALVKNQSNNQVELFDSLFFISEQQKTDFNPFYNTALCSDHPSSHHCINPIKNNDLIVEHAWNEYPISYTFVSSEQIEYGYLSYIKFDLERIEKINFSNSLEYLDFGWWNTPFSLDDFALNGNTLNLKAYVPALIKWSQKDINHKLGFVNSLFFSLSLKDEIEEQPVDCYLTSRPPIHL